MKGRVTQWEEGTWEQSCYGGRSQQWKTLITENAAVEKNTAQEGGKNCSCYC